MREGLIKIPDEKNNLKVLVEDFAEHLLKSKGKRQSINEIASALRENYRYYNDELDLSFQALVNISDLSTQVSSANAPIGYNSISSKDRKHSIIPIALALKKNNTLRSLVVLSFCWLTKYSA